MWIIPRQTEMETTFSPLFPFRASTYLSIDKPLQR